MTDTPRNENAKASENGEPQETAKPQKSHGGSGRDLKNRLLEAEETIAGLRQTLDKQREDLLRQMADKENLRKRLEKEKSDYYQFALTDVFKEILSILDNYERALGQSADAPDSTGLRKGVELIHKQILALLERYDVRAIPLGDGEFDPNFHQALMTEESEDVETPRIGEVLQSGYTIGNRLLRPLLVKVIVPKRTG